MIITITKGVDRLYPNRVRVHLNDDVEIQGVSHAHSYNHVKEAIGDLIVNHPDKFMIEIRNDRSLTCAVKLPLFLTDL